MSAMRETALSAGHVLIIDDDPEIAACVRTLLEQEGYRADAAIGTQEALARITAERPEAVFLGPHVDLITGEQLQEQLQTQGVSLPIVSVTAATTQERACDGIPSPNRPLDLTLLVRAVARLALAGAGS